MPGPIPPGLAGLGNLALPVLENTNGKKKKKRGKGLAEAAIGGATTGATGGPVGAVLGGVLGAGAAAASENQAEKKAASAGPRPKRRRLSATAGALRDRELSRAQSLASLSQAAFDLANQLR